MKKAIVHIIVMQVVAILLAPSILGISNDAEYISDPDTSSMVIIYVDDDGGADYTKVQDAIDNATNGDTIIVYNGTYNENIVVNKRLSIMGIGDSILFGMDETEGTPVVLIEVDGVEFNSFIIEGLFDGIVLSGVDRCLISNNYITHTQRGIFMIESFGNVIANNSIVHNTNYGIMLQNCAHDYIQSNEFTLNEGIALFIYNAANNEIEYNNFRYNQKNAFFINAPINYYVENYWDRARIFPKIIFGLRSIFPWVNFDWHPAQEPYVIP